MSEAYELDQALGAINTADPQRFEDSTILPLFEYLRREDPVHYCEDSP